MPSEVEKIRLILLCAVSNAINAEHKLTLKAMLDAIPEAAAAIAALRSQGREDGAREMREASLPKAVVFRQLTDDERRDGAEALARAYRDERTAAHGNTAPWPAGCLKPNSCARHRRCMYAPSSEQCRHYGLDLTEAVARAEAAASPERTEAPDA